MDFINELFGSEISELKANTKVNLFFDISLLRIDRRINQEVLHLRGLVRTEKSSPPSQEGLRSSENCCIILRINLLR